MISPTNFSPFLKNPSFAKFFIQLDRFDELCSGILNVNKYIKAYSGKDNPQFIEGATFKTIIPVTAVANALTSDDGAIVGVNVGAIEGAIEGVFEGATEGVKKRLVSVISKIYDKPSIKAVELRKTLDVSERTILSDLKRLEGYLDYKGSKKTGGYHLKNSIKKLLDAAKN